MSLPAPYQEHYYIADGVTTSFSFGEYFTAPASANVKCIVYFEDGTSSVPAFTVNIVTGFINITALTTPDGQVLNAPPAGSSVRVFRDTPEQQNVTASQIQNYTAKQLEKIFDSIVAMIQEVSYSDKHKTLRLTETQRDVFLSFLKEANDDALLYWDNESKTITPTDFVRQDIVRMSGGLFFRMKHDAKLRPYLEWSINGQTDWNSLNLWAQVDTSNEAKEIANEALTLAQSVQGDLSSHTTDLNNPHATSMGNLTDTDINAPTAGQFMKYDGSKWVNSDSSASVSFDGIEGNPYDNTALADALNNKANSADVYTKNEIDTALNNKADKATTLGGYNISDAYTKSEVDTALADKADVATTYNKTEVDTIADGKANTDLSNLTAKGKNIANWSSNVINCITEIPQDIKLELNNGTLTLKAGSKVYVPNGAGVFDITTTQSDIVFSEITSLTDKCLMFFVENQLTAAPTSICYSGTNPSGITGNYYNTTANTIDYYNNGSGLGQRRSFPICEITVSNNAISSIDQVFNGFGYIGSTVFALPGVKGLAPNGRNPDGSLKNNIVSVSSVITGQIGNYDAYVLLKNTKLTFYGDTVTVYRENENRIYDTYADNYVPNDRFIIGHIKQSSSKITSFTPKTTFHAVDYNDSEYIAHQAMPSNRYIDLTVGSTGATYVAPADGYFHFFGRSTSQYGNISISIKSGGNELISFNNYCQYTNNYMHITIPISKGQTAEIGYFNADTLKLRFVYANGGQ